MPNGSDLLDKNDNPNKEDNGLGWYKGSGSESPKDDLASSWNADNSGYDSSDPKSKAKGSPLSSGAIKNKERDPNAPSASALGGENSLLGGNGLYSGDKLTGAALKAMPTGRLAATLEVLQRNKGKSAGITGGIITLVIILMSFAGSSFELIHVRQNLVGNSPFAKLQKASLKRRQTRTVVSIIKKLTKTNATGLIANERFTEAFRNQGFEVEFTDKKLTKFAYTNADGVTRNLDITSENKSLKTVTSEFFEGDLGREISGKMDTAVKAETSLFRGAKTTRFYNKIGAGLQNWLENGRARAGPNLDDAELQQKVISEMAANDGAPANTVEEGLTPKSASDLDAENQNKDLPANQQPQTGTSATPSADAADLVDSGAEMRLAENIDNVLGAAGADAAEDLPELALKAGFRGAISSAVKSAFSYTEAANLACRLKGAAQYVGSIANVLLAYELGKFSIRYLSAADHAQAGLLTGAGLAILMKYLHANQGYLSDGGMQFHLGNSVTKRSAGAGMFNRKPQGLVGKFLGYSDRYGLAQGCSVVTNGWFQIGQAVVMGIANIPTLGGVSASSVALQVGVVAILGAAVEITVQLGTSYAAKAVKQEVMSGVSNIDGGHLAGAAIAAGFGSQMAMTGSVNGNTPSTKTVAAALKYQSDLDQKYAMKNQGWYDRYLSINSYDSLINRLAFKVRSSGDIKSLPANALASATTMLTSPARFVSGSAYADTGNTDCDDPQLIKYNIETDPFCNPLVATAPDVDLENAENVLTANGMIDALGNPMPGSNYESFIKNCLSGRTGLLYKEKVDTNGTEDINDDTCVGGGLPSLAGVTEEKFTDDFIPDMRPWYAKLLTKRAEAATSTTRKPTTLELYTAWYGYKSDLDNMPGAAPVSSDSVASATGGSAPQVAVGELKTGFPVPSTDTSSMSCPVSPTISEIGVVRVYANSTGFYNIKLCRVHGYSINAVKAKDFDDMYNAMIAAGFKPVTVNGLGEYVRDGGGGNFRTYEEQAAGYARNPSAWAQPGNSNHEKGLAVDTACTNKDNSKLYRPWMTGKIRGLDEFARAISEHPCLNWLHNNSSRFKLLLQCDGKGSGGGEIAASKGGCETWHLSPTGG